MAYNGIGHKYLLPSVIPKLRSKTSDCDSWMDEFQPPDAPPPLKGNLFFLGRHYCLPRDLSALIDDLQSRIWCTYRKNFRPIGDTGYTSDSGWGCTLRCGQMLLGHALLVRHLGRGWRWKPDEAHDPTYQRILRMFLDSRDSEYSIQMIALQGADFGRSVGQWFGPNNVAQAIKRLVVHDKWSKMVVYVAMDMLVIIDDIKKLAQEPHGLKGTVEVTTIDGDQVTSPYSPSSSNCTSHGKQFSFSDTALNEDFEHLTAPTEEEMRLLNNHLKTTPKSVRSKTFNISPVKPARVSRSYDPSVDTSLLNLTMEDLKLKSPLLEEVDGVRGATASTNFRPVLIFIPLRLGQEKFNMEYKEALKACFSLKQNVGVIGGKPRHALWFIGYHEDFLLFLDPHRTQQSICNISTDDVIPDSSYHCSQVERIHISELDPSLALGFFCHNEADLDDLCDKLKSEVLSKMKYMFELTQHRPSYWDPPESAKHTSKEPFILLQMDKSAESEEGFELVDWPYPLSEPVTTPPR